MTLSPYQRFRRAEGFTLVELLVTMSIMAIVSTMLIVTWISLQRADTYTLNSNHAREAVRDAVSRMRRELRDMQQQPVTSPPQPLEGEPPVLVASTNEIDFTTPFNDPGAGGTGNILLTRYYYNATTSRLYRQRDMNNNGVFDSNDPSTLVAQYIVNGSTPSAGNPTPVFQYSYYDSNGVLQTATSVSSDADRSRIQLIQVRLLADLNAARPPVYMDLMTTVQPRNMRQT